ncbi:MBG domain-containing protein [Mucilaginibacter sp. X4EP1]|uniref:MBG domain-containing protein n=1 Tax=Mucilaginibacter sp. X4EP1 TaxID=2723092 RepID=UPI003B00A034
MKKLLLAITSAVLLLFISSFADGQTTLSPGDIAVVGYDFSFNTTTTAPVGSDNFDIVVLKNIAAGTVIQFTSRGWLGTAFSSVGTIDGFFTWTVGSNITAGSVFNFSIANGTLPATVTVSPSNGAVTGTTTTTFTSTVGYSPSTGNQIFIFQGTQAAPTFIYGINTNATNMGANGWVTGTVANNAAQSALPSGLTNADPFNGTVSAPTALPFTLETNRYNAVYVGPLVGSQTTLLADIGNYANWTATSTATTTYNIAVGGTYFPSANPVFNLATPIITASGTLAALTTTTGTASSSTSFSVSATSLTAGVLVTPPSGFQVSTDNSTFSGTVTVGSSGTLAATTIYVRLAAADGVGTYSGNIVLSSTGATGVNVATASSTVNAVPAITASGTLAALSTTTGTASTSTSFSVSATALTAGVLVTPPSGFQVSTDNSTFSSTVTVGSSGTLAATTIYIRLAAADGVGTYSGNVVLSSTGATSVNVATASSTVTAAPTTISSITDVSSSLTNASSVQYTVTFGASVTGVTTSNFSLATTGSVSGAAISAISGSGATYTITVNTGTGDGTIGLNLANATSLSPGISTTLPFTGSTYTIDKTPPTVTISVPSVSSTSTGPVTYTVTYADANFNSSTLAAGNITLNKTGTATGSIAVSGTGLTRTVTISSISGTGSIGISIAAGTASDNAGNVAGAAGPSATFTVAPAGPAIAASGTLSSLNSIYGSASASESFNVSGTAMTTGILVTPPTGFEVSTDNSTFSSTVTIGAAGTIASTPVYIRLKAGEAAGNYSGNVVLSSSGASSVNEAMPVGVVSQASLAIIANNQTKAYGAAIPTLTASYSGFVNGDTPISLTTPPTITTTATAASQVAGNPYAITASGAVDPNYTISYVPGSLTIGQAPLTITADNQTKAYGAAIPTLTASYTGFVNGDTPISLTTPPTITTTATAASQVAGNPYAIAASGAVDANYAISYVPGILTIGQAPLTITADNQTKAYGAAIPTLTASYSGFVNGDTPISLTTPPTITTTATAASQVAGNPYAITASGAVDPNYTISYVPGILTIGQAPLTITADNQTKAYGAAIPTLTASYSGFVNGDTPISLTTPPTITTTATAASQVAGNPYAITASGAVDANYAISYVPGTLTIGQAPLTITADNQTKAYGAAIPTLTASYSGFVNGDTPISLTTPPTITTTATAASQVAGNPYAITASGAVDPNYTISYVPGTLTIGQAPLTITADNQTKAYGAALPTLTASYSGFVNGDTPISLTVPPTITTTATAASQVAGNPYAITASGAVDPNYTISYVPGILTIGQAPLTITADNQTKAYGAAIPTLTASYAGFVNGDTQASLTTPPTITTTATAASQVAGNPYAITASGAVDPNYTISYVPGILTIGQAPLTITADNQTKAYGAAIPTLTASYTGFVNGDNTASLTTPPTITTTATAASQVAGNPYAITASGAVDNNYTITYTNGTLTIGQAALNITADNQTSTYGSALPALTVSYAGFVNGDTQASLTTAATTSTTATAASPAGSYTITPSGAVDNNYQITYTNGTLTIGQAALTVTADNQTSIYGQALPALTVTYSGFVNGDTQASLTTAATASTTATAASPVGSYTITPSGAVDNNYAITYTNGTLTIGQAALTVTADNQTSTYGQAIPALTVSYAGFVNGDTQASLTTAATASTTATAASPAGSYTITPSGAVDNNYAITYTNGTLTIGQAALNITADNQTSTYGSALPALTVSYAGFVNGDTQASLTTAATASTTATAASPAGSYTITPSGAVDNNYAITYTNGTLTIGQAALTVTADNQSSTYGQALPALTVSYSGFVNGDTQASLTTAATASTTATAASPAGSYTITPSGAVDNNYAITYTNGTLTIGQAGLSITADNQNTTYGQALPALTVSYAGFVNGDTQASLTTAATASTTATAASPAGSYTITPSGAVDNNYAITYTNGTLTIGQAVLTVTADNQNTTYGQALPALTVSYAGFVNGDTQASLTTAATASTTATAASPAGSYTITPGGAVDNNYTITYTNGTLTIGQAALTITANNQSSIYGQAIPALTVSYAGFVNGDTQASLTTAATASTTATAASPAGSYTITPSGAVDNNYAITYTNGTLTIGQAALNVTADNQNTTYGQALPALTVSYAGFVNGDTQASLTTAATASTTATAASPAGSYTITPSGAVDNNYAITYTNGTLTIGQAALNITADNQNTTYGQALPALTVSYAGFVNGDTQASLTTAATASTTATAASPAGSYTITPSGAVDNNYAITYTNGTLTIGQAALTVTADNQSSTYGQALPALTVSYAGFVNGDTQASLTTAATASTTATAASPAGSYTITPSGAVDNNYAITYTNGTLTIGQAALTITADNQSKVYGAAVPTLTASYSGFVNGDTQASLTTLPTITTTATAASPVAGNPYAITASGAVDNNYIISYVPGTLTVSQAALTITADNQNTTYGQAIPALTVSYAGFVNGDTQASLTTAATASTTATAASPAGSYTITPSGAVDNNYAITYTNGTLTIGQAALNITADNQTSTYGSALPALTVSYAGFVNGDTQASLTTAATASTTATAASPAGSYTITPSGAVDNNYAITYTNGTLTIGQAALNITADNQTSTYGSALPALTVSYAGFVNGDTQASLTTAATASTTATAASPAGSYTITPSGAVDNNYAITYTNGTLTIGQAALNITADNQTKAYGAALPTLTASYSGFVNGDTPISLTVPPTITTTATAASQVAGNPYAITASGAVDPNYTISYVPGILTIGQAPLTITADNQTKAYGAAIPTLTASYAGFVNGDTQASLTTPPTITTTATAASQVAGNPYAITASGAVDPNYTISYVPGILTIGQAPLTITADNQTKAYGAAIPTLTASYTGFVNGDNTASLTTPPTITTTATAASQVAGNPYAITASGAVDNNYTITYTNGTLTIGQAALNITADNQTSTYGSALPALTVSYAGFVNGDTQASLTTAATTSTTATAASPAGSYTITPSGAVDNNYQITYTNGTLTIGQAALTVTADNQTSIYGQALPALTVTYSGFVNGDTQASLTTAATASTTATAASPVGSYTITPSGAVDNNYAITYTNGTLTIGQAALTVTADNQTSTYGQAIPALTVSYAGFVNGDTQASLTTAATASTTATAASPAGSYTITPSGAVDNNYAITYTNGTLTIGQAALNITADNQTSTYGSALPALTVSYAGFVNGDTQASLTTAATASTTATAASPAGSYTITPSGAVDNNYAITYTNGTLTIGQAALTVTADNQSSTYGQALPALTVSYSGFVNGDTQASLTTAATASTTATAASPVGSYTITPSGAVDNNYAITYTNGTLTIGQAALNITADNQTSTYGSALPALTVSYAGFVNGDTQASLTTAATASTTATAASPAGSYTITPSGAVDNNYAIIYTNGTLTIGQAALMVTADNQSSTYGQAIPALTVSYAGFVNGDTQASLTTAATASTTATAASPAGSYTITPSGAVDNNYAITYTNGTLTIGQAALNITADNQNTTYGQALPALTVSYAGFVNGDTQASLTTAATASTTATAASPAGSYTITPSGAVDNNYAITYTNGTLTIGQAALTVTADNQTSIYGQALPALTVSYAGFVNGDTQASLTTAATASTTATAASPAGSYTITPSGAVDNNYAIIYTNGTLTIGQAALNVTADNQNTTYGQALPALTVSYAGFVNGDTQASLTTAATASTTATAASPAGSYTITPSGAVDNNYAITYTNGTLTIGQAALTITADNQSKVYGAAVPTLTAGYAGFVNGDTQASLTTLPTITTSATAASQVAGNPYAITASGAVDNNYTISYVPGILTITTASLSVTADNQNTTYGQALPALTVSYVGFVNGDTQASLTTAATASTTATAASPAGSYTITPSGAVDNNYAITYTNGTLTIGQAALNVTADNQNTTYGQALPALTVSYVGFVNGDTQASLTTAATASTTATAASPAGSYTITPSGAVDNNYAITYTNGTLTIGQAALNVTADNQTSTYGQAIPALTVSYAGFVNGDTQASLTTAATASTTATAASPAGSYTITPSGAVDNNYAITYTNGTLTIGQAALNITADNQTSTYGSALPALTVSYAGFVNGDTQASLTTAATASTTATAASPAGSYTITPSGAVDNNYQITYTNGTLTIGQAALTVTADNQTSIYGQALPALTVTYSGFVNGDTQASLTTAATASTTATAASPVGSYTITPSGAVDNNYAITYTNGTLTIGQAALTVTADNQTSTYGQAIPALTVSYAGFVNGDTQASLTTAATASTTATAASPAGSYTITPSGAVDNNYAITYTNGTLTIGQAALTITADNQSKVYGAAVPTLTASYTGFVNGDTQASLTTAPTLSTTATASSAAGTYPVTASGAADNNYTISYVPGTLTVSQAALTITANNQNSTYGSVIPALTVTYSGFVNGDTQASLTTAATASTTATAASPAGSYTITPSGAVDNNYAITYTNGTLTIGQAVLTITADNQNSTYGSVIPALTVSYSGFVNGDTQASLTTAATASTTATAASPAGSYTITPSGAADNNYAITYANGTLTIGQAVLTVTADNQNTTYGSALPALTVTYSGFVNGDTQASLTTAATASTTATTASPAGSYTITPGGAVDNNYTITYTNGTLTIGQAALTVTANNQSSIYGQAIPALTVAYSGFVNGDTQASLTTAATASTTATAASMVGVYPITPAGAVDNNYAITYVNGTLTITAATATLTFAPIVVKTYGDADFGPGATTSGGETIIYTSSNTAVATIVNGAIHITGAGTTTITATLAASSDYTTIPSISRQLVVNKAQQTISFAAIPNQLKGGHYDLSGVTASSGLAVSFSSSNPLVAAVQGGNSLASFQLGTTDITASQSGDNNYEAAPNVTQPVNVVDAAGDDILVHQAVSPNGDGINDFLYIEGIQNYPENEVTLISRNGVIVYQGFKYDNTSHVFDGHSNITGALQQAGTYFYRVEIIVNGERKSKTGYFVLKYQ